MVFFKHNKKAEALTYSLGIFSILLIFSLMLVNAFFHYRTSVKNAENKALELSKMLALSATHQLSGIKVLFRDLVLNLESYPELCFSKSFLDKCKASSSVENPDCNGIICKDFYDHISRLCEGEASLLDLLILSPEGEILHWGSRGEKPDLRDRPYVRNHYESFLKDLIVSPPMLSRVYQQTWFFAISQGVYDANGHLLYILAAMVDLDYIMRLYTSLLLPEKGTAGLITDKGQILLRVPDLQLYVGKFFIDFPQKIPLGGSGILNLRGLDASPRLLAYQRIEPYSIFVFVSIASSQIFKEWLKAEIGVWMVAFLFFIILGFLTYALAKAVKKQEEEKHALVTLAGTDSLTGLANRRQAILTLERAMARFKRRENATLSILMLDIDYFKAVNDTFGHPRGDAILQIAAKSIEKRLRASDLAARIGGEEFLVILPDTDIEGASVLAEFLRLEFKKGIRESRLIPWELSVSIGVCEARNDDSADFLVCRADALLYQAKKNGRDMVIREEEKLYPLLSV